MKPAQTPLKQFFAICSALLGICLFNCNHAWAAPKFTAFESGQVRPLALSVDGKQLFAVNTPDNRLEVFKINGNGLRHEESISVGLEPVAVAAVSNSQVWVVNHLSDSVSIVDFSSGSGRVVKTLLVGDEPRDIVFAGGTGKQRAFISAAHRGQNTPFNNSLFTPGIGRADVWVFDPAKLGASLGGTPVAIVNLFSDSPRALAVSADGKKVYAAAFISGNKTALVPLNQIPNGGFLNGGIPLPNVNHAGLNEPDMGLLVQHNGSHWVDETGRIWDQHIKFNLPDRDVFVIDAEAAMPALEHGRTVSNVGTVIFNLIVNPANDAVYATNTEARNHLRFEGAGLFVPQTLRGHTVDNRISIIQGTQASPRLLNKHINYAQCCSPIPNAENQLSVSQPNAMAITADGATLYVAALGNQKVVKYNTQALENNSFYPDASSQIALSAGGPSGMVLDERQKKLYVLTRFDNGISIIDLASGREINHINMFNPEPVSLIAGRRFLYDAAFTSSHGDQACASCHIFGDKDELAWDLGNPDGDSFAPPNAFRAVFGIGQIDFHPMKGPMATQSLRGLANHGPMHWRGDRNGGDVAASIQPDGGAFNESAAFNAFNVAFEGLLGRSQPLTTQQMQAFTDFALQLSYPPNPVRALDNSLSADQAFGKSFFESAPALAFGEVFRCIDCHSTDRSANAEFNVDFPGFFGTSGLLIGGEFSQTFKIPHLRNLYTKIGAFGMAEDPIFNRPGLPLYDANHTGEQIRGFGFAHDGSVDTPLRFMNSLAESFVPGVGFTNLADARKVAEFLMVFDSNLFPVVGQQITWTSQATPQVLERMALLKQRADLGECELIAKASYLGREQGFFWAAGLFHPDQSSQAKLTWQQLTTWGAQIHSPITYTCVPPGSGRRLGIDRDGDEVLDGDENKHSEL